MSGSNLAEGVPWTQGDWLATAFSGFAAHNGPLWRASASHALALRITRERTNITGRIHGGMAMSLQSLAFSEAARRAALQAQPAAGIGLVTCNCELIDSAMVGDWVVADVQVVRTTRTLVFLSGGLRCGNRPLMTASAVFRIGLPASVADPGRAVAETPPPGYHVFEPVDAFSAHVGPMYERFDEHGERFGGFHVCPRHLEADGSDAVDTGMLNMLADLYLGRRARVVSSSVCVTLGMTLSQLAPIRLGDLVEIESRVEGRAGDVVIVTGTFRVGGRPVMTATSAWKVVVSQ